MIPIEEFQRRSFTGPVMREQQFDLAYSQKVRQIAAKYGFKYNPEEVIADDNLADAVFQGGVDLLAELGVYNKDTYRVIEFTRQEVEQIAREAWEGPRMETIGQGKDRVVIRARTAEDPRPPVFFAGLGSPPPEELHIPYMLSAAQEELALGVLESGITPTGGVEAKAGTPGEVIYALRDVKERLEVAQRVGKPQMWLGLPGAITPGAVMACYRAGGLDRFNSMISIQVMPEQKITWTRLTLAACAQQWGIVPWISGNSILGALSRGPEESAITMAASLLAQLGYGHGNIGIVTAISVDGGRSRREVLWTYSAAARASERHIGVPISSGTQSEAGACTEMAFYEKAAQTVAHICSGAGWTYFQGCRGGKGNLSSSGLECRLVGETGRAVAGMRRPQANEMVKRILAKYETQIGRAPKGKDFPECYDVKTVTPTPEYVAVYDTAKAELARLGVPYKK